MPRSGVLLTLSREHHLSLIIARLARQAATSDDPAVHQAAMQRIEAHWETVLREHFAVEESLLKRVALELGSVPVARILSEHHTLCELIQQPSACELPVRLHQIGELLAAHVRYEEREVFVRLQQCIDLVK